MNAFNTFLIFAATGMFCFLTIRLICRYLLEKLEFRVSPVYEELKRFISPDRLLMLRIFSALITACAAFLVQLAGGVEKMLIALPVSCGFAIAACAAEIPCVAADGVANAEARVIGQFAQIFDLTGKFMPDDRFWQRPGAVVALVERDIVVTDADIADAA